MFQWLSAGRRRLGGGGRGSMATPCPSPKYPKYVPFLAAKPQQCLPSTLGLRVCKETSLPQGPYEDPQAPVLPTAQPQPAWHRSGGTGGHGHPSCSSFRQPAWPPSLCRGEGVCFMDTVLKALGHLPPPTILGQNSGRQGLS